MTANLKKRFNILSCRKLSVVVRKLNLFPYYNKHNKNVERVIWSIDNILEETTPGFGRRHTMTRGGCKIRFAWLIRIEYI